MIILKCDKLNHAILCSVLLVFHRKDLCEARVKLEMSSNLADKPSSGNGPPQQMNLLLPIELPSRQTFFCQIWQMNLLPLMDPKYQTRDALNTSTHSLADEPILANGPPKVTEQRCFHTATDI